MHPSFVSIVTSTFNFLTSQWQCKLHVIRKAYWKRCVNIQETHRQHLKFCALLPAEALRGARVWYPDMEQGHSGHLCRKSHGVTAVFLRSQGHWVTGSLQCSSGLRVTGSLQCSSDLRVTGSRGHCSVPQVSGSLGHCSVVPQVSGSLGHRSVPQVSGSLGHCSVVPQVSGSLGHCSVPVSRSQKVTRFHVWRRPQKTRSATFSVKLAHGGPKAVCCVPRKSKTYKTGYCFWLKILLDTALGHEVRGRPASQRLEVQ